MFNDKNPLATWAEREVELACQRERDASGDDDLDYEYGAACYRSALKAFKSLTEDGHSGFSIGITKQLLMRLIDMKPLTPIEDTPDVWSDITEYDRSKDYTSYQNLRMGSLFKHVYTDGSVKYHDVDRCYCVANDDPENTYRSGLVSNLMDELFPISMPYFPKEPMVIVCEEFLSVPEDSDRSDYDTVGVLYGREIEDGEVKIHTIKRFFKEDLMSHQFVPIDETEYLERRAQSGKFA